MSAPQPARAPRAPSWSRLLRSGLWFHARIHLAVALGVMAGTAVLTGALLVGDSVRGSLRHLTLDRLGRVDSALVADQFFRSQLAAEVESDSAVRNSISEVVPAILLEGSVEQPDTRSRANQVTLIGCDTRFWNLATEPIADSTPDYDEVVLNQPLADQLGVKPGDEVLIRLPAPSEIPSDSPLGRKTSETIASRRLTVRSVLPAEGLGRFGLRPNQQLPRNAWLNLELLQDVLGRDEQVNALLAAGRTPEHPSPTAPAALQAALRPTLADYGLTLDLTPRGYFRFGSSRMLLSPAMEQAGWKAFGPLAAQPVLTYLANTIAVGDRQIPYSTIAALDLTDQPPLGPLIDAEGQPIAPLADDEIVLNQWAADDLQARPGDIVRITYFEPESTHGVVRETTHEFRLKAVCQLDRAAADPALTPELPGVTDQLSIANWNPPFPYDPQRIRDSDEQYWDDHRATPKGFVSLAAGRNLWSSRFGNTTSLRIPPGEGISLESLAARFEAEPAALGLAFQPVKQQGLQAAAGTTPFNALFIGFSFFIIAAAVMLVALLFRLGVDRRASEAGLLAAVGWSPSQVQRLFLAEGVVVAAAGGLAGMALGVGYAWLMLTGLRTWWVQAITTPFLRLFVTGESLAIGMVSGVLISLLAIVWALRQMRRVSIRTLLAGRTDMQPWGMAGRARVAYGVAWLALAGGAAGSAAALLVELSTEAQAGAFFGSASLVLVGLLALVWARLRSGETGALVSTGPLPLVRLAVRNAARNPGRSTLTIGLMASATFLIVAISAFRLDPPAQLLRRNSGTGGFSLVAQSTLPIFYDLGSDDGRFELGFSTTENKLLADTHIYSLRQQEGEDASCLNLYQTGQPSVLGVPELLIRRGGFAWAASAATTPDQRANPWLLLDVTLRDDDQGRAVVPVVIDAATAQYSLHLSGIGARYRMTQGPASGVVFEVVGLLANSTLQGSLIIGERQFLRHFPLVNGYRFFLIETPQVQLDDVQQQLQRRLGDYGLEVQRSDVRLAGFLAVQNTYLSTFQSLGALGLLLGTFGLATVQLRNVLERRGELALLRATGFRRGQLAWMVMCENLVLLAGGLLVGCLAALVAVIPHLAGGSAVLPWGSLGATLAVVLATGALAGLVAVRAVLRAPLLAALRGT